MDLISMFLKGGFLMWPILLLSVLGLTIVIERVIILRKAKMNAPKFMMNIRNSLRKKDIEGAINLCMTENTPASNIIRKGLNKYKFGHERVKEAIEDAGRQEIVKLERGLTILATISGAAPLLGFLGTVTGMISAFYRLQELKGSASPSDLAGGIWEALITTAFGLAVGIPALVFYNYFVSSVNKLVSEMESISTDVVDTIEDVTYQEEKR